MNTKRKLIILELIAGICGWTWIIASLAALYFLIMVVFFDESWNSFFWTLAISIISKWLARGFQASKNRVTFEAKLVSEGWTAEEAGKEWIRRYTSKGKN